MFGIYAFSEVPFSFLSSKAVALTGVQATGSVGTMIRTVFGELTGVSAAGQTGIVTAVNWQVIDVSQTVSWQTINSSQT
jgi:hypothetical protein